MKLLPDERGSASVLLALLLTALIGITGLVIDVGNIALQKAA